mgnify:CR=1 FL=1
MKRQLIATGAVLVVALAGGGWWWVQQGNANKVEYRTAPIGRGSLQATVAASGAVSPVSQVSVGTQVSGQIRDLLVDFNTEVKAGQLLAQIDPETFEYRVRSAQADVDAARAAVLTAQANALAAQQAALIAQGDSLQRQADALQRQAVLVGNVAQIIVAALRAASTIVQEQIGHLKPSFLGRMPHCLRHAALPSGEDGRGRES